METHNRTGMPIHTRQSLVKHVTIIFKTAKMLNVELYNRNNYDNCTMLYEFNNQKNSHSVIQDSPKHQNVCKKRVC